MAAQTHEYEYSWLLKLACENRTSSGRRGWGGSDIVSMVVVFNTTEKYLILTHVRSRLHVLIPHSSTICQIDLPVPYPTIYQGIYQGL